ncbi:terminase gpP N-terminus-related DNA-binding protein [Corynebacterium diphtheriae]|uniref:terminase gpP N-terminus-related DNA-binding protein n=1 Tax=Corynebacterium diphtheriae TaxID=1717 RepID=UPI001E3E2714|nr:hypothetical protein [Corynebacterium diphtheriae]
MECELRSKMSVYSWAQRHREEGKWGLMSKRERKEHTRMPTRAAFEKSLADDPAELKSKWLNCSLTRLFWKRSWNL